MECSEIVQLSASAVRTTCSTALRFITGSEPGSPRQTGQVRVFGSPPNSFRQPQNILLSVRSSAWHSIPTFVSYFAIVRLLFFVYGSVLLLLLPFLVLLALLPPLLELLLE